MEKQLNDELKRLEIIEMNEKADNAVAVAVAYVSISSEEGEDKVLVIKKLIEAVKKVIFNILAYVIDLTPYAVLCLTACSASQLLSDKEAL